MKRKVKIAIDILMLVLFIYLINYQAGMGLLLHGVLGITLFVLFLTHHLLNIRWYASLTKGKYNLNRAIFNITDGLLFVSMVVLVISSIMISSMIFPISFIPMNFTWREIHVLSASTTFILMVFHLGLHTQSKLSKLKRRTNKIIFHSVNIIVMLLGIWCFGRSRILKLDASYYYGNITQFCFTVFSIISGLLITFYIFDFLAYFKKVKNGK